MTATAIEILPYHPDRPVMTFQAYGIGIESCEDGDWIAAGHHTLQRFIAACNKVARTELGWSNLWDSPGISYEDVAEPVRSVWAVRKPKCPCLDDCARPDFHDRDPDPDIWWISWVDHEGSPVTESTPGALPYMVARP